MARALPPSTQYRYPISSRNAELPPRPRRPGLGVRRAPAARPTERAATSPGSSVTSHAFASPLCLRPCSEGRGSAHVNEGMDWGASRGVDWPDLVVSRHLGARCGLFWAQSCMRSKASPVQRLCRRRLIVLVKPSRGCVHAHAQVFRRIALCCKTVQIRVADLWAVLRTRFLGPAEPHAARHRRIGPLPLALADPVALDLRHVGERLQDDTGDEGARGALGRVPLKALLNLAAP